MCFFCEVYNYRSEIQELWFLRHIKYYKISLYTIICIIHIYIYTHIQYKLGINAILFYFVQFNFIKSDFECI